ncbi:MAG TPA: host attachment protein [Luteimonas sp.]|nr:host attachment protein [Luteimonas sp.]
MSSTWVMVADGTRARLFALDTGVHSVAEIGDFINPGGRDLADPQERPPPMAFEDTRQASATRAGARDTAATPFASELNAVLQRGRAAHRFQDLILVAPPPFLETLHGLLDRDVRACVAFALPMGMIEADLQAIFTRLPSHALSTHQGH